jgi:cytochrome b involved in lipid metabolism
MKWRNEQMYHLRQSKALTPQEQDYYFENVISKLFIEKIHNKYYDLTDFKHPGGPIPIGLIENRDGTELFESHHLFTNKSIMDILESYEMKPAPIDTI